MTAYYNEHDPFAAAWLRELIKAGHIAPGEVDERSIEDVLLTDLRGFTQCHFFAGIGVWSYALRAAGWPDDRPVWTGSCPCQPFSTAGKRKGTADERHLWPSLYHLISQLRPFVFFGEQVASKDGLAWFDTVSDDLEAASYTVGSADLCAAGFGAPHIRQRLYFVADSMRGRTQYRPSEGLGAQATADERDRSISRERLRVGVESSSLYELADSPQQQQHGSGNARPRGRGESSDDGELGNTVGLGGSAPGITGTPSETVLSPTGQEAGAAGGLLSGFWQAADWIPCRDGKYRPVEPGTFPLAHGTANRVGRLRGYGNALVAPVAAGFIEAYLEVERDRQ